MVYEVFMDLFSHLFDSIGLNPETYNQSSFKIVFQEIENGRLFRIMVKLGSINERPE